jgi:hypothetical protein
MVPRSPQVVPERTRRHAATMTLATMRWISSRTARTVPGVGDSAGAR